MSTPSLSTMNGFDTFVEHFIPVLFTVVAFGLFQLFHLVWNRFLQQRNTHGNMSHQSSRHSSRSSRQSNQSEEHKDVNIRRLRSFKLPFNNQHKSPLFNVLPGEVRDLIYEYVFAEYEDSSALYEFETCYRRPGHMGPKKIDTALLRTCQVIYDVAWYIPWTNSLHTFYLTVGDRRPTRATDPRQMQRVAKLIEKLHPHAPDQRKQVRHAQIFAQCYLLEPGSKLNEILQIPHFRPRHVTITIRHTDMWYWESDHPMFINTPWVQSAKFPASTTSLTIEFEAQERRKIQVDYLADHVTKEWAFERSDNIHLINTQPPTVTRWTGSSSWSGDRWIRDEDDREPGRIQFYVSSILFTPADPKTDVEGYKYRNENPNRIRYQVRVPPEIAAKTNVVGTAFVRTSTLHDAGGSSETPASEALRLVQEYQTRRSQAIAEQRNLARRAAQAAMRGTRQVLGFTG